MERITPVWQPNEKECLIAILEMLIDEGILATCQKLGYSELPLLDSHLRTNIGLEFERLLQISDVTQMIIDFLPYFWMRDESFRSLRILPNTCSNPVIKEFVKGLETTLSEDGAVVLVDTVTPECAQFVREHRENILRVISLLGPSLQHVCNAWHFQPEQYKALICWDTLDLLDPPVRWNMIYGSRML